MSVEQRDRNNEIFKRYKSGEDYFSIANDYGLTYSRVYKIVNSVGKERLANQKPITELRDAAILLNIPLNYITRLENCLIYYGYFKQNKWKRMSEQEILKLPNIGERAVEIINLAKTL